MSLLESILVPLGSTMPDFQVKDPEGKEYKGNDLYGERGLLIAFTCNHCPYAIAVWPRFIALAEDAKNLGINAVAINPNINPSYPEDGPKEMIKKIKEWGIKFPYLVDATQGVAENFKAQCTPDMYMYDKDKKLVYHGRIDDNWKDEAKVTRHELKEAITHLGTGEPLDPDQKPSMGCSIKWVS